MRNAPLIISLLVSLIVVLVIVGVSIQFRMNTLSEDLKKEHVRSMDFQQGNEVLKGENSTLKKENGALRREASTLRENIDGLGVENEKLKRLKEKIEENLKDALMEKQAADQPEAAAGEQEKAEGN